MSLDLFQQEANERLTTLPPVQNVDPGMFDGFVRGTGMATMKGFAKAGRAIDLLGAVGPIVQDAFTSGTEAQDKYFAEHDAIYGRAVDYWTPKSNEIGSAAEVMGTLLSVIPQVIVSPALAVGTTQLGTAEDLVNAGVTSGKANMVGAIQGAGLGVGIWMPILGQNLWQRALIGGAGFNMAQGVATRAASGVILEDTPAKDMFKAFDGEALTLDALLGMAFGSLAHLSPQQRTQGKEVWGRIQTWAQNLSPTEKAAIATLREGEHLNVDSTPGRPVEAADIEAHVERMRTAIDQLATDQPVAVEDIIVPRRVPEEVPEIQQLREELSDATTSRAAALEAGDQETANRWNGEIERINRDLVDKTTIVAEDAQKPANQQPRFELDPERLKEAESTMRTMVAEAQVVRAEEGLPPPPEEPPRVTQSVRRTIEEELARAGRPAEEAAAGAALWDAFYTTMAKRLGTTADDLWSRFPLARITREAPGGEALKQGPGGEPVITVAGRDRPITNAEGKRIASDIEELKAFWNWFKDSKVVGPNGKPQVAYHGSRFGGFSVFMRGGNGYMYFTADPAYASSFAGIATPRYSEATVYPVYLSIKNPIDLTGFGERDNITGAEFEGILQQHGVDTEGLKLKERSPSLAWSWIKDPNLKARMEDAGFDGIKMIENTSRAENRPQGSEVYVAFQPEQIKSAIGNRGTFDPKNPDILFQGGKDTWYKSALGEAITKLNMKAAPAKGWLDALKGMVGKNNVKAEEIKWSGIEEWLQLQEGKITKEQVQEFLTNNGVKVEEAVLGGRVPDDAVEDARDWINRELDGDDKLQALGALEGAKNGHAASIGDLEQLGVDYGVLEPFYANISDGASKYGQYQLPGGENYRELLLTLPKREAAIDTKDTKVIAALTAEWNAWREARQIPPVSADEIPKAVWDRLTEEEQRYTYDFRDRWDSAQETAPRETGVFQSSHFEQPNILAHVRFNERTDADGKKVLFIEEFQSDWAQKGKREGFNDPQARDKLRELVKQYDGLTNELHNTRDRAKEIDIPEDAFVAAIARADDIVKELDALQEKMDSLRQATESKIPAAPFVGKTDAWVGLALKRMIAYAAENGFDRVAWTRGEQQVERYTGALRKAVDVIEWKKTPEGVQLVGYKGSIREPQDVARLRAPVDDVLMTWDNLGFDTRSEARQALLAHADWADRWGDQMSQAGRDAIDAWRRAYLTSNAAGARRDKVVDTTEKEDALSDAIGKAMAEKIISDPNQSGTIEGDGTRIDSTGMAGFYDRIVPKVANEVLKKLGGGKVAELDFGARKPMEQGWKVEENEDGLFDIVNPAGEPVETEFTRADAERALRNFAEGETTAVGEYQAGPTKQQGFDITPAMKAKVEGGLPLFQKTKGTERGYMSMGEEGRVIGLLENADASTFVHESGHFFLDTLAWIGKLPDVPAAVRADLDTALQWAGLKDPTKWPEMSLDEKRPYHEKFARGFEQYLREGVAPSPELKGVFQRFRDWLVELYKSAKSLNVKLNDDIRGVLNRMLADQVRNPSTEAPLAPAGRAVFPPPPGEAGKAPAGAEVQPLSNPELRTILQGMADNEVGWAQIGGRLMDANELGTGRPSFTTWIPKAEWWRDRPDKKMNGPGAQEAVRKALAGEKLKPIEQRIVDHMINLADERRRGIDQVGGEEEYQSLGSDAWDEGLEPTTENVVDLDLVARAAAIDEAYVERAAIKYENDDAAFRGELEMLIYEHQTEQAAKAAGRSTPSEPAPSPAETGANEPDAVRDAADRIVAEKPDMLLTIGTNPDGSPMTIRAAEFLEQERAIADAAREDVSLFAAAANCLFGG